MNKIIRLYNKNRKLFWIIVIISIIIINIPKMLNKYTKENRNIINSSISNTTIYNNKNYSIISEETIKEEKSDVNEAIINEFINFCNNKNPEKAYELLSNSCKEKLYPTLNEFINKYYNNIFESNKSYIIQAWISQKDCYTYKINLKEDILSTGNIEDLSIEDYYTIIKEDNNYKLNINNYIKNVEINKESEINEVKITALSKDIFMDYEIYNLKVKNKTMKSILVDSLENPQSMYLEDNGNLKYFSYSHEIVPEILRVRGENKIKIKFNKKYSTQKEINKMVFSDIILDYDEYRTCNNKSEFINRTNLEIEL